MTDEPDRSGADILVEHITECTDAQAVIVVDGSADEQIARLVEAGWTLEERVDRVAGKRIRFIHPPAGGDPDAEDPFASEKD